ncbi:MAG: amidohydrolase [Bacteroidetes bacterium]|nr:amidohydrolase [Bacteroidota bacterium]MBS1973710.1 amidohydrolase [Bacteroidota bacterium]
MRKLALAVVSFAFLVSCSQQKQSADKIYINAKIWSGDTANDRATAIAVKDSLVVYVGNEYNEYKGSNTEVIDLGGQMIVPGFIDNHAHFLQGGYQLASVNLRNAKTEKEFIETLKEYSSAHKGDSWIMGGDWDHEAWGGKLPTRFWIDSITGNHPVFIERYDGHMSLANSIALKLAGVDKHTPDPPGGEIVRDAKTGEPTGVLKDGAADLISKVIPAPTQEELDEYLKRAVQEAFEHGITEVNDMSTYGGWPDMATYRKAYAEHKLDLRIYSFVPLKTWAKLDSFVKKEGWGDAMLHWGGLKGFVDGSLGSTTAWFYKPYLDAPGKTGLQVTDTNDLRRWILSADSAGLHCATHAIGDKANDFILSVYEEAEKKDPGKDRRFRVEHAQHLTPRAILKFEELHVIPSMQPYHLIDDGKWAYKRLDSDRLKRTYAFKTLLNEGANLTFGSDWPVAPLDPIAGIYAAVTRRTLDDKNPEGWFPAEKISVEQALKCYTANNAYASFQENKLGKLKAGMLADFAVLSADIFAIAPEKIRDIKVMRTIVNGKEVWERK